MNYRIVGKFGPGSGERWVEYLVWRGLKLARFDSVDGILRPVLFTPATTEDWGNCFCEDYRNGFIANLSYARNIVSRYVNCDIVGIEIVSDRGYVSMPGWVGFDIIDGYSDVSLLTDWGTGEEWIDKYVGDNGLLSNIDRALNICDRLRETYPDDSHAQACEVWAVYEIEV